MSRRIKLANSREIVEKFIDIVSIYPQTQKIGKKEREFFIESVLLEEEGVDISSKKAVKLLTERMGFKRESDVYRYRGLLKDKEWMKQTVDGYAMSLKKIPKELKLEVEFYVDRENN